MVPVTVPVPTFEKLTVSVPVPVPAPYLDHKKQIFQKILDFFLSFDIVSCFIRKKFLKFNKFILKCE
jgi:hypothetical protein